MGVLFDQAWADAIERHAGQMYGPHKYDYHLGMVVAATREIYGDDDVQLAAAALHDTIEDTGATREYLEQKYGADVGALVWAVSADPTAVGRRAKQKSIAQKLGLLPAHLRLRGINLKMTDRKCNQKASVQEERWDLVRMYASEDDLYGPFFSQGNPELYAEYQQYCHFVCPKN